MTRRTGSVRPILKNFPPPRRRAARRPRPAADPAARRGASRSAAAASRPGGSRPGSGRRRLRMPSMQAASWVAGVLPGDRRLRVPGHPRQRQFELIERRTARPPSQWPGRVGRRRRQRAARGRGVGADNADQETGPSASASRAPRPRPGLLDRHRAISDQRWPARCGPGSSLRPGCIASAATPTDSPASAAAAASASAAPAELSRRRCVGAVAPASGCVSAAHRRRRAEPGGQGQLRREARLHHRGADSGVGGGTRLHGGRHGGHRASAAQGLAGNLRALVSVEA